MNGKTPRIDRIFDGIGRVHLATGTHDKKVINQINVMLDDLRDTGQFEVIRAIASKNVSLLIALEKWKKGSLRHSVQIVGGSKNIHDELLAWVKVYDVAERTRISYESLVKIFLQSVNQSADLSQLPSLVRHYKEKKRKMVPPQPKQFNDTQNVICSFLRDTLGKRSSLYLEVRDIESLKYTKMWLNVHLSVKEADAIAKQFTDDNVREAFWGLVSTGMRPKEFYEDGYKIHDDHIYVNGQKTEQSKRKIPLVLPIGSKPSIAENTFADHLKKVTQGRVKPYDLRRTYHRWLEAAGVSLSHIDYYTAHKSAGMTALYLSGSVTQEEINEDANKIRNWIDIERKKKPKKSSS